MPESEKTSKVMSANRGKDTGPEISLRKALWAKGVRGYRVHPKGLPGRPDIVFPKHRLAIMVNGCFWHRCPICKPSVPKTHTEFWQHKFDRNVKRDHEKIMALANAGWAVIVVWECELKRDPESAIAVIMNVLNESEKTRI
ncbi:MAG: very short patch repair endonuclease [Methanomassiliicoccales archaeon]